MYNCNFIDAHARQINCIIIVSNIVNPFQVMYLRAQKGRERERARNGVWGYRQRAKERIHSFKLSGKIVLCIIAILLMHMLDK